MDAEKMEYLGNDEIVKEISMKAAETADRFIFETVLPFCQENYQGELKKEDLSRALGLLKAQEPVAAIAQETPIPINDTTVRFFKRYLCGKCRAEIKYNCKYCHNCGQAVKWDG